MMTSFNALTLEVYYRYLPLFKTDRRAADPVAEMGGADPDESKIGQ